MNAINKLKETLAYYEDAPDDRRMITGRFLKVML